MKKLLLLLLFLPTFLFSQNGWNMNLLGSFNYPTTNLSDIWGWEDSLGNEYALVGVKNGFSCVDVTNPSTPVEKFFISDINSTWRDIKSWGNYAYITTEANAGLLIVDLSDMTGNTYWHVTQFSNPSTGTSISFTSSHNIYIDENGIAYIFGARNNGTPVANRGAIFLDVNANAIAPIYLGEWAGEYIHDGMARGDTLYAGCIYQGAMYIIDVSDKTNPQTIGQHATPNNFTHNAWVSDDGNYVFTTDEQSDAYLAAYDISNINNIQEVDRIQSNPGSNSIPHNTHVDGNFLITSYYRDGTIVHDITYPSHMIQVAYYDSYAGSGNGFNGCWGTYPFLSSGNIISSDRDSDNGKGILNIYGRDFQQACYLMGNVTDGTNGNNISSADITLLSTTTSAQSNIIGDYQTAVVDSGTYQIIFSKSGYISDTLSILLDNGIMTILDAQLYPIGSGCTDPTATNYNPLATVDDGSCIYAPSCTSPVPTGLSVTDLTHDRAKVNWLDANTSACLVEMYRVQYKEQGTTQWSTKTALGSGLCNFGLLTTSKRLWNLTPSTIYEYRVKAWYCLSSASTWSPISIFTTLDPCPNVLNFAVSTPLTTKAVFTWTAPSTPYSFVRIKLRVDTTNASWFTAGGFGVMYPALTRNKNGLTAGQSYRASSRTWCNPLGGPHKALAWTPFIYWTQPGTLIRIDSENSAINNLTIYPNPSRDVFNISFVSEEKQNLRVRILNVIGEEVYKEDLQQFVGEYTKQIDLKENPKAIYFLEIETDDGVINKKLILQ